MMTVDEDRNAKESFLAAQAMGTDAEEVVGIVERHQKRQRDLCRELEVVADSLPLDVDPSLCMRLARTLLPALRSAHDFKEDCFYRLARKTLSETGNIESIIERLRTEYHENELIAEEVAEELSQWGACAQPSNPETVGYMLRGCFISLTRHLDFERVVLIEPIKSRLSRPEAAQYPEP